jgi:hypothetical protein
MIPRNHRNRKVQVNLSCPGCGMNLTDRAIEGYVFNSDTFCCRGCAVGSGCTCTTVRLVPKKAGQRPGDLGQRNPENSVRDRNFNEEVTTSGKPIGNRRQSRSRRVPHRGDLLADGRKAPRSQSEPRDSSREQARGRSEFVKRAARSSKVDRVSRTGTKAK